MPVSFVYPSRFYWTRQHGAYITMITSWIIAIAVTGFSYLQLPAIIFLLASINEFELLAERMTRKSPMPKYKLAWIIIYGFIVIVTGIALARYSPSFREIIFYLSIGAFVFVVLANYKFQKSLLAELLTFAFFVVAGFSGSLVTDWSKLFPLMLIMALFFATSVFSVKQRLDRISELVVFLFTIFAITVTLFVTNFSLFGIMTGILLLLKTSGSWAFRRRYGKLKIKQIGMLEIVFQILFIVLVLSLKPN